MLKIGLLSDTHGYFDPQLIEFFKDCDRRFIADFVIGNISNDFFIIEVEDPFNSEFFTQYGEYLEDKKELKRRYNLPLIFFQVEDFKEGTWLGKLDNIAKGFIKKHGIEATIPEGLFNFNESFLYRLYDSEHKEYFKKESDWWNKK